MTDPADPLQVRIVGSAAGQVAGLVFAAALLAGIVVYQRRARYFPLFATRTARTMRQWATRIEDAGLNHARPKEQQQ